MDMESSSRANMPVPVEQNRGNIFERSFDCSRPCLARAWLCLARSLAQLSDALGKAVKVEWP